MFRINIRNGSKIAPPLSLKTGRGTNEASTKLLSNSRHTEFKFSEERVNQPISSSLFELCMYREGSVSDSLLSDSTPSLTLSARSPVARPPSSLFRFSHLSRHLSSRILSLVHEMPDRSRAILTTYTAGIYFHIVHPRKRPWQTSLSAFDIAWLS